MACAQYLGGGVFESRRLQQSWRAAAAEQRVHKTQLQRRSCGLLLLLQFCYCCCTGTACYGQENERNGCSFAFENSILLVQQGLCIQKFQLHNFLRLWLFVCMRLCDYMLHVLLCFVSPWLAGCDYHNLISCSVPKRKREGNSLFNTHFFLFSAREKERKETPYSIRIFLFSAREK